MTETIRISELPVPLLAFGSQARARDGGPERREQIPFALYVLERLRPRTVVELGTATGDFYVALCDGVAALGQPARCYAIPAPDDDTPAGEEGVPADLRAYHDPRYGAFSRLLPAPPEQAAEAFSDGSVDFLHLVPAADEQARPWLAAWLPKLSPQGALLLSHTGAGSEGGGAALWNELRAGKAHVELLHGTGAGLLLPEEAPAELRALAGAAPEELEALRRLFAVAGDAVRFRALARSTEGPAAGRGDRDGNGASPDAVELEALREEVAKLRSARDEHEQTRARLLRLEDELARFGERLIVAEKAALDQADETARARAKAQRLEELLDAPSLGSRVAARVPRPREAAGTVAYRAWTALPEPARGAVRPVLARRRAARDRRAVAAVSPEAAAAAPTGTASRRPPFPWVPETVSVAIPTLNGGPKFARVLAALEAQEGLGGLELIVIDSGSSDGTVELARAHGARVLEIPQEEFNHGETRNRMAELAGGEVLLLTVQDAVPVGRDVVRRLVLELRADSRLAAVSARQIPYADSDLYAAFVVWAHSRATAATRGLDDADPAGLDAFQRRGRAQVDNVCAAVRRRAWEEVPFRRLDFAEDLDFGVRAVERGWRVASSHTAAVVHSHVREATYHLRRAVVDRLVIAGLFEGTPLNRLAHAGLERLAAAARVVLGEVQGGLLFALPEDGPVELAPFLHAVGAGMRREFPAVAPQGELAALAELLATDAAPETDVVVDLRRQVAGFMQMGAPQEFARAYRGVAPADAVALVCRLTAAIAGEALGDALREEGSRSPLAARLRGGV
jgi:glycosyltransferase involved in cell wall biosynthesis